MTDTAKTWSLTWGKKTWTEADLTGQHLTLIVMGLGGDSWDISPVTGPVRLQAVLAAFITVDTGRDLTDVVQELNKAKALDLLGALSIVDGD